jgi:nitrogen regulatory protein PII
MNTHPMKLVTIVCEALAREWLTRLLLEEGAHGYTLFRVEGTGAKGSRVADIEEFTNIQVEVVVPAAVAERLLTRLHRDFLPHFAVIVFESDVQVLRPQKF